jgi:hypothetical protein
MRQCIERAFGSYVARWGIFRRPLVFGAEKWGLVAGVCAKLHNFCIQQGEGKPLAPVLSDIQPGDDAIIVDNGNDNEEANRAGGWKLCSAPAYYSNRYMRTSSTTL